MVYEFKFPDVGEGIHEGEIVKWFVKEGDSVKADEPLGEVETDKAVVEMPSPKTGKILKLHVPAGSTIHVGENMVTIQVEGESDEDAKKHMSQQQSQPAQATQSATKSGDVPYTGSVVGFLEEAKEVRPIIQSASSAPKSQSVSSSEVMATPAVRNLAKQKNVDLALVKGTGPSGRITVEDIQKAAASGTGAAPKKDGTEEAHSEFKVVRKYDFFGYIDRVKLHGIRKAVANRMTESIFTAVQLTNTHEADVTDLESLRQKEKKDFEKEGIKLTTMAYLTRAVALSLQNHPFLNSSLEGEEIVQKKYYNIGIAVDTEEGLMVPVVKGAAAKEIKVIAKEIENLANDVKSRKVNMMELKGGSFTISNLGSVGVEFFTPVINYPESAILGVGRTLEKPVVRNGKIEVRKMLPLSLTYDHRIVDGGQAARFMIEVIKRLETLDFKANPEKH